MEILRKTVNLTINEIDTQDSNNNQLIFYETYDELIAKNETLTLEVFIDKVEQKRDGKSESGTQDITITNACEAFFYFSQSSLSILFVDLEMFNQQYTSFISKIRIILSKKGISMKEYMSKIYCELGQFYFKVTENIKLKKLSEFYKYANHKLSIFKDSSKQNVYSRYNHYREWINNTKLKDAVLYPVFVMEKVNNLSNNSRVFIYNQVYQPTKDITFTATGNSYNFVIKNVQNVRESSLSVYSSIKDNMINLLNSKIREDYIDRYVKIHVKEEKNLIIIEISKNFFVVNSSKMTSLISNTLDCLKNIKIRDNIHQLYEKSKETSVQIKDNFIEKYKRFVTFFEHKSDKK